MSMSYGQVPNQGAYQPVQPSMGMALEHNMNPDGSQDPDQGSENQQPQQLASEFNIPVMCRIGQETVQEIVQKASELFANLRSLQPPTMPQPNALHEDRRVKLQETMKTIETLFRRLRRVHQICDDNGNGDEYTTLEPDVTTLQNLIPMCEGEDGHKPMDEKRPSENMKMLLEERERLTEQVTHRSHQLKEIIDMLRNIICEINTMLAMRKKHLPFTHRVAQFKPKNIY